MDPTSVGFAGTSLVIGKHSGRAAFRHALDRLGVELTNGAFDRAFSRMKQIADQSGEVSDGKLLSIVDEVVSGAEVLQGVTDSFR
jgi:2-isopropylmalate synthase